MRSRFFKYPISHLSERQRSQVRRRFKAAYAVSLAIFQYRSSEKIQYDDSKGYTAESFVIICLRDPKGCDCHPCAAVLHAICIDLEKVHV